MGSDEGLRPVLLRTALALLESDGDVPSLRAVARAANVSAMAPYRHFEDKAALLAAVADRGFVLLGEALTAADAHADPREALYSQGIAFTRFARTHPALFGLMFGPNRGHAGSAAIAEAGDVLERRASELAPDDSATATLACRALVQGLAVIEASGRLAHGENPEAAIRFFTDHLG